MSRNEAPVKPRPETSLTEAVCSNCGGALEPVGNRLFMMYKRARLPQPKQDAQVCAHCGWVEGDETFRALLEQRLGAK
jgi:hypothetical protein